MSMAYLDSNIDELAEIFKDEKPAIEAGLQENGSDAYLIFVKSGIINGELLDKLQEKFFKVEWIASSSFEKFMVNIKVKKLNTEICDECEKEVLASELTEVQVPNFDIPYDSIGVCKDCMKQREHDVEVDYLNEQLADLDPRNDDE